MKKILLLILLILCLTTVLSAEELICKENFREAEYQIKVGSLDFTNKLPIFNNNGNTYVSLRDVCSALGIPVYWDNENRIAVIDRFNSEIRADGDAERTERGIVPDAETAYTYGKMLLESYAGRKYEYETEKIRFYLDVDYSEAYNAWYVAQYYECKGDWGIGTNAAPAGILLNKNTGEVVSINTRSVVEEMEGITPPSLDGN
ncbi:MAG: hypothetical protein IJF32_13530 [Oscillospiraceae bacterium]|nr:hypothetical protein [Oscillospiraceae bacterium]